MSFLELLLTGAVVILAIRLYLDRRNLRLMQDWILGPLDGPLPDASGVWGDFVSSMNQRVKIRTR